MRRILTAICVMAALPAGAGCLTAENLAKGIAFTRSDGRHGFVIARAGGIFVDYAAGAPIWMDQRQTVGGIYETATEQYFQDEEAVGGGVTHRVMAFRGDLPVPVSGRVWQGKMKLHEVQDNSSEQGHIDYDGKFEVEYNFLPEIAAKLSGCSYRAIPVEARLFNSDMVLSQRWIYLPDLGFGIETKRDGVVAKLMTLKPM